jgi:hypothetical protein
MTRKNALVLLAFAEDVLRCEQPHDMSQFILLDLCTLRELADMQSFRVFGQGIGDFCVGSNPQADPIEILPPLWILLCVS